MNEIEIQTELGKRLRYIRKIRKLRQETVAKRMGLTRTSVVNIEQGRQAVSIYRLAQFAEVFCVEPYQILAPNWKNICSYEQA